MSHIKDLNSIRYQLVEIAGLLEDNDTLEFDIDLNVRRLQVSTNDLQLSIEESIKFDEDTSETVATAKIQDTDLAFTENAVGPDDAGL